MLPCLTTKSSTAVFFGTCLLLLLRPMREPWARRTGLSAASERAHSSMLGAGPLFALSMMGARRTCSGTPEAARRRGGRHRPLLRHLYLRIACATRLGRRGRRERPTWKGLVRPGRHSASRLEPTAAYLQITCIHRPASASGAWRVSVLLGLASREPSPTSGISCSASPRPLIHWPGIAFCVVFFHRSSRWIQGRMSLDLMWASSASRQSTAVAP